MPPGTKPAPSSLARARGPWLLLAGVVGGMAVLGVLGAIARSALRRVTA